MAFEASVPDWVIYNVPDGLWMLAFSTFILILWNFSIEGGGLIWYGLSYVTGIIYEVGQEWEFFPGTFDVGDIVAMTIGCLLAGLLFIKKGNR